ncbi:MAG: SCO family protein [Pseudomonadales bacterium]|nr:SCO family protein [Pseudomonadales bacterium]
MTRGSAWLLAAGLLISAALWQSTRLASAGELPVLYTLGGDFALRNTGGGVTRLSDLEGNLVLLNFGYTSCPDVCPAALARMRDVLQSLPDPDVPIQPLFVTLDPQRDTLDRLQPYMNFFGADFLGLTGTEAEIAQASAAYKVFYEKQTLESELDYSISHSSHIYLLDTRGRVRATFGEGITVPRMIDSVRLLLAEEG